MMLRRPGRAVAAAALGLAAAALGLALASTPVLADGPLSPAAGTVAASGTVPAPRGPSTGPAITATPAATAGVIDTVGAAGAGTSTGAAPAAPTSPAATATPTPVTGTDIAGAAGAGTAAGAAGQDISHWVADGFTIAAPASMWPMLDLLHTMHFDWELASAAQRPTPLVWAELPDGVFAQFDRSTNVVRLSRSLQTSSVEAGTAFLAHELTHLNDDLNGRLYHNSTACYAAETRAFENEANFWSMVFGPQGKRAPDPIEARENMKMWAFVGDPTFADLVVRTTPGYVRECGTE